ncbi:MAG TPA: NAD(P)/FAD-dependent oxidoreductase [Candidatus Eisenbacteria bacterium]|nr:NAD(P)/FAD-dependent oxidoreductase [Candidatus Eisenbacteria bacterium]
MTVVDVAVVGAGPAGSSAAVSLARLGYTVALLDKRVFPRDKLCGDFLNPASWPILNRLGVARDVLERPHQKVERFRFAFPDGQALVLPLVGRPGIFGLGLRRADLDHALMKRAALDGVTVFEGCRAKTLTREAAGWFLVTEGETQAQPIKARVLVGADGRHSWVAQRAGLARGPAAGRSVAFQWRARRPPGVGDAVEIHLMKGGYAGIVGVDHETINVCVAIERKRLASRARAGTALGEWIGRSRSLEEIVGARLGAIRSTYPVYFSSRHPCADRVLLVGDAARVSEPVTGEGVYLALWSGLASARVVDQAFRSGDFSHAALAYGLKRFQRPLRMRRRINALARSLVYRRGMLSAMMAFSAATERIVGALVRATCEPDAREPDCQSALRCVGDLSTETVDKSVDNSVPWKDDSAWNRR